MVIAQGDVWWAALPAPTGPEPGFRRPMVVVQGDSFNASAINTVICVPLTGNLRLAFMPGNVFLPASLTGLPQDSIANASQLLAVDKSRLTDYVSSLARTQLDAVLRGIDILLGR